MIGRGGGSRFAISRLPGILFWSRVATLDALPVSSLITRWRDEGPFQTDMLIDAAGGGTQPTVELVSGRRVVRCYDAYRFRSVIGPAYYDRWPDIKTAWVALVAKFRATTTPLTILTTQDFAGSFGHGLQKPGGNGGNQLSFQFTGGATPGGGAVFDSNYHIYVANTGPALCSYYEDGALATSLQNPSSNGAPAGPYLSLSGPIDVLEVAYGTRLLVDSDLRALHRYLAQANNLPLAAAAVI